MQSNNAIRRAVRSAMVAGAAATAASFSPAALAQDVGADDELEEIIVTGSRIPADVLDAPRPVSTITRAEIDLSGLEDVASLLRTTTFNSFGSFRERSGTSFGQIALVNLRGLGEDRTAVLINGRRVPGNPLTGTSAVDLNSIPLAAVEQIEILTDSASAVYGADAIGGVINVIMRDDFDGLELEAGMEFPERDGADAEHVNVTFGTTNERSSILFSAEWYKKDPIFDADRDYSRVQITPNPGGGDPRHNVDTIGVSSGGNTGFALDFSDAFRVGNCPTDRYIPLSDPEGIPGAEGCGFGYADLSMQTGGIDRKSTFLDARYEVTDDLQVYFENRFSDIESFGRYAPAVGFFLVDEAAPLNPIGEDFFLFHRFVGHGNRDDTVNTQEIDSVVGLTGNLPNFEDITFDVYARYYDYTAQEKGQTYVITSIIEDLVANGSYDFINPLDPANQSAIQQSSATLLRDIGTEFLGAGFSLASADAEVGGINFGWAAGFEIGNEEYRDLYDSFREASNVLGSAGNSAQGERDQMALFGELQFPLLDEKLLINLAGRWDDYDQFSSEFSPQISVKYSPTDRITLRASAGEGFKAPNLADINQELAQSFETITDLTRCNAQGIAEDDCPNSQVEEYTGGNQALVPEESESFNLGAVITPIDDLTFSLDYFNVEMDGRVEQTDLQDLIDLEIAGQLPDGVVINRAPTVGGVPGVVTNCAGGVRPPNCGIINIFGNISSVEVEGIDLRANYTFDIADVGEFRTDLEYSHLLKWDEETRPGAGVIDRPGTEGFPEGRANLALGWNRDPFSVNLNIRWIDEHEGVTAGSKYDAYTTADITAIWQTPWDGELTFGIRNITDEDPSIDNVSGYDDEVVLLLYDVAGRVPFLTYKHAFDL